MFDRVLHLLLIVPNCKGEGEGISFWMKSMKKLNEGIFVMGNRLLVTRNFMRPVFLAVHENTPPPLLLLTPTN